MQGIFRAAVVTRAAQESVDSTFLKDLVEHSVRCCCDSEEFKRDETGPSRLPVPAEWQPKRGEQGQSPLPLPAESLPLSKAWTMSRSKAERRRIELNNLGQLGPNFKLPLLLSHLNDPEFQRILRDERIKKQHAFSLWKSKSFSNRPQLEAPEEREILPIQRLRSAPIDIPISCTPSTRTPSPPHLTSRPVEEVRAFSQLPPHEQHDHQRPIAMPCRLNLLSTKPLLKPSPLSGFLATSGTGEARSPRSDNSDYGNEVVPYPGAPRSVCAQPPSKDSEIAIAGVQTDALHKQLLLLRSSSSSTPSPRPVIPKAKKCVSTPVPSTEIPVSVDGLPKFCEHVAFTQPGPGQIIIARSQTHERLPGSQIPASRTRSDPSSPCSSNASLCDNSNDPENVNQSAPKYLGNGLQKHWQNNLDAAFTKGLKSITSLCCHPDSLMRGEAEVGFHC